MDREQLKNAMAGLLRGSTADVLGMPVDTVNSFVGGLPAPEAGNPYANALHSVLGIGNIQLGSGDWWANKLNLPSGEGLPYHVARMLAPNPAEVLSAVKAVKPVMREITTYHGTPHRFPPTEKNPLGEFDLSKIGTGEGAQAYGHGIYVAESPNVAQTYQRMESNLKRMTQGFDPKVEFAYDLLEKGLDERKVLENFAYKYGSDISFDEAMTAIEEAQKNLKVGNLYTVDLPDEHVANMLDWDKPLSEQTDKVKAMLRASPIAPDESVWPHYTGEQFYEGNVRAMTDLDNMQKAAARAAVSEQLKNIGIPGLRYLDKGSRAAGEGTSNFVLFDPSLLNILGRE